MNIGTEMGVGPGDIVATIMGETGLAARVIGPVDMRERHLFVEVATEHEKSVIAKLNRAQIMGRRLRVKVA